MEKNPLISVIIPVYNVEKWLLRCVNSVCGQSYKDLEILLIDDGSTDRSGQICENLSSKDSRIIVIHRNNGGLSEARNTGLVYSHGEYISFIDSDDWIERNFIQNLINAINDYGADACGCNFRISVEGEKYPVVQEAYSVAHYSKKEAMEHLVQNKIKQVVWNKLYRADIIKGIFFEIGKYHEDEFWTYQVFGKLDRYTEIDYIGYNYFQRAESIMGQTYSLNRLDAVEAKVRRQIYLDRDMKEVADAGKINLIFTCFYHGQQALTYLDAEERHQVFNYLKKILRKIHFDKKFLKEVRFVYRLWIIMGKINIQGTCIIRNRLKIGI